MVCGMYWDRLVFHLDVKIEFFTTLETKKSYLVKTECKLKASVSCQSKQYTHFCASEATINFKHYVAQSFPSHIPPDTKTPRAYLLY